MTGEETETTSPTATPAGGMTAQPALVPPGPKFRSPRASSRGEGGRPDSARPDSARDELSPQELFDLAVEAMADEFAELWNGDLRPLARRTVEHIMARYAAGREDERQDVAAYLSQRADNAAAVARTNPPGSELRDMATDRRRQCEVIRGDLKAGLHHGAAQIRAELKAAQAEAEADAEGVYTTLPEATPAGGMTPKAALVPPGPSAEGGRQDSGEA